MSKYRRILRFASGSARSHLHEIPPSARAVLAIAGLLGVVWALTGGPAESGDGTARGAVLFRKRFTPAHGLGPLFNAESCSACHREPAVGGVGPGGLRTVTRFGRLTRPGFDSMLRSGGPVARAHAVAELAARCDLQPGVPAGANVTSLRNTPPLFGVGSIDAIPDRTIRAQARFERRRGVVSGRPNLVREHGGARRVGRFGWKGDVATLGRFVADALRNELGVTSPSTANEAASRCRGRAARPEIGGRAVAALTAYVATLPAPKPVRAEPRGAQVFAETGCTACHTAVLEADPRGPRLYSDLLLHNMGPALDDHVVQEAAHGSEWRTAPLWGLSKRSRYLHDGRADTLRAAILAHGGEAAAMVNRFQRLSAPDLHALTRFLSSR